MIDGDFFGEGAPVQHDLLDGGPGNDTVSYQLRFEPVHIDLTGAGPQGSPGENEVLDSFESAEGGAADDVLIGNAGANRIVGGFGDDLIDGGLGADDLEGTSGDDTVSYAGRTAPVTVDLDEFFDVNGEASESDFVHNFDNVRGGAGADHLSGTSARNVIEGGGGADVIGGRGGADELHGGDGGDSIDGGDGPDYLYGDAGADTANGGAGDDSLRLRDNEADSGDCGGDVDTAVGDAIDSLAGCETADTGVAPSAPAPQPQQQQPSPVPDTTAPRLVVGATPAKSLKRKAFLKGLPLTLTCDEACSIDVELRGSARSVRLARAYDVVLAQSSLGRGAGARKLKLKPNRKLTGKARRLTVQLRVVATDAAGNRTTVTRTLKVR